MTEFVVSSVGLAEDGIELAFMRLPDDVRSDGKLITTRSISVANDHPTYRELINELRETVTDLVTDLYRDFESSPITEAVEDDDEDDDEDEEMGT